MFGKVTEEDRDKLREELEDVHVLFKQLVAEKRPNLDIETIATGEHWYGTRALELGLVDELGASDDYLLNAIDDSDIYHVTYTGKRPWQERIFAAISYRCKRIYRG